MKLTQEQEKWALDRVQELVASLNDPATRQGGLGKAAALVGMSKSLLSQLINGKYSSGNRDMQLYQYAKVKEAGADGAAIKSYVPTSISEEIQSYLAYCQAAGGIMTICGAAGIGKTQAIRKYVSEHRSNTIHITMRNGLTNLKVVLSMICTEMGLSAGGGIYPLICRLSAAFTDGTLIIIDEAQHMSLKQIDLFRSFAEEKEALGQTLGFAFVGNLRTAANFGGCAESELGQIASRALMNRTYSLADIRRDDIKLLFPDIAADSAVTDFLLALSRDRQGIRGAVKAYTLARDNGRLDFDGITAAAHHRIAVTA